MIRSSEELRALAARVALCQISEPRRSFGDMSQRQFNVAKGEYLNDRPADGTVMVQGRPCEPLASPPPGAVSMDRTVKVAPGPSTDLALPSPHDPMDFGWRRSTRGADLAAINARQAQLRSVVADLPGEAAATELLLSSVRHAVDYLSEDEVAEALGTVAAKIMRADYKWIDLYMAIVEAFKSKIGD